MHSKSFQVTLHTPLWRHGFSRHASSDWTPCNTAPGSKITSPNGGGTYMNLFWVLILKYQKRKKKLYLSFLQWVELYSQNSRAIGQLDVLQNSLEGWRVGGSSLEGCWRCRRLSDGAHGLSYWDFWRRLATKVEYVRVQVRTEWDCLAEVLCSIDTDFHQCDVSHHFNQVPVTVVQTSSSHWVTLCGVQIYMDR